MTTDLGHRRGTLIVSVHAHLTLKGKDPPVIELLFLLPVQNKVQKKGIMDYYLAVNVHTVITSAILAPLHIMYTGGLGSLLLLQISFNSNELRRSNCYMKAFNKA